MTTKLYDFQREGVSLVKRFKYRALLADEMGLGKTIQALTCAAELDKWPVIVCCPKSLKYHWAREASIHLGMSAEVVESTKTPHSNPLVGHKLVVINYDILYAWVEYLMALRSQLVIYDEAHYVKSRKAKRTKSLRMLCAGVPHVLALTGTPLVNRPAELWSTLNLLRPDLYPSFWTFAQAHCDLKRTRFGWDYSGAKHLGSLHLNMARHLMIRRRKEDVLKELPAKIRQVVPLSMENPKAYYAAVHDFLGWLREHAPHKVRKAQKSEAITKLNFLKHMAARQKLKAALEWVEDFLEEEDGKLLIATVHRDIAHAVQETHKRQCVLVTGEVTGLNRQKAFDQFNHNEQTRLFVGNVQAAGVGWSARASNVAFMEFPWTPGEVVQFEDRIHGIKRGIEGERSHIYFLVAKGSIEESLVRMLDAKANTLSATLDGGPNEDDLDIWERLTEELRKEKEYV